MHRQIGHPSLAETLLPQTFGRNQSLERIDEEVGWEKFAAMTEEDLRVAMAVYERIWERAYPDYIASWEVQGQ